MSPTATATTERGLERLICTALTGKLDAREAAANLPAEPEKSEVFDETVTLGDANEATEMVEQLEE